VTLQNFIIQVCGWLVGLPLEVLVVSALVRGPYRLFPLVFVYAAATFVTTLVEIPPYTQSFLTGSAEIWSHAAKIYWINEWILQVLVFAVVINLIDQATSGSRWRRVVRAGLAAGALLFAGTSFLIHYRPPPVKFGIWMTPWTMNLSFGAAILDMGLWMMLIASRKADRRLLLISGALGLQFTGEAIGEAIRNLSVPKMVEALSLTGSVVAMLADLACLYIWWQTFRAARGSVPAMPRTK
jgi:hypothetical protein